MFMVVGNVFAKMLLVRPVLCLVCCVLLCGIQITCCDGVHVQCCTYASAAYA